MRKYVVVGHALLCAWLAWQKVTWPDGVVTWHHFKEYQTKILCQLYLEEELQKMSKSPGVKKIDFTTVTFQNGGTAFHTCEPTAIDPRK